MFNVNLLYDVTAVQGKCVAVWQKALCPAGFPWQGSAGAETHGQPTTHHLLKHLVHSKLEKHEPTYNEHNLPATR